MTDTPIFEALNGLRRSDCYPFHMPGHKRNMKGHPLEAAYEMDITEIDGFDNLHDPQGLLLHSMEYAAKVYGTKETFFLVNGSTAGILTAIHACVGRGEKIIIARNCHQSVYNAVGLLGAKAAYLYPSVLPQWNMAGEIPVVEVERALEENPDAKALLLTSPTYEGIASPIAEIVKVVHKAGIPLIVDEAHGAHFPFSKEFPRSSLRQGADIVIQSVHKTLPAFTQTALLHIQGELVESRKVKRYLSVFQSSSPSYLLMGGIDDCIRRVEKEKEGLWSRVLKETAALRETAIGWKQIRIYEPMSGVEADPLKLVLGPIPGSRKEGHPYTAMDLYQELRKRYQLQLEMVTPGYVVAIVSCMDRPEGLKRLCRALQEIDSKLERGKEDPPVTVTKDTPPVTVMSIAEAQDAPSKSILLEDGAGRIAACFIKLYPPGIPLVAPGEVISQTILDKLIEYRQQGFWLQGLYQDRIRVIDRKE